MAYDDWALLAVRVSLSAVFLYSAYVKVSDWNAAIVEFQTVGLPFPAAAVTATVIVQLGGALALLTGVGLAWGALALAAFTAAATVVGHPFWRFSGPDFTRQLTIALEHLGLVGGLVLLAMIGPGQLAI